MQRFAWVRKGHHLAAKHFFDRRGVHTQRRLVIVNHHDPGHIFFFGPSPGSLKLGYQYLTHMPETKPRVAIIDDEPRIRELLELTLGHHGYAVRTAPDGPAGLDLVKNWSPDVI